MIPLWRVTRNPYARAIYDLLKDVGVTATKMYEYEASLERDVEDGQAEASASISLETLGAAPLDVLSKSGSE